MMEGSETTSVQKITDPDSDHPKTYEFYVGDRLEQNILVKIYTWFPVGILRVRIKKVVINTVASEKEQ